MRPLLLTVALLIFVLSSVNHVADAAAKTKPFKAQSLLPAMDMHLPAGLTMKSVKERLRGFNTQQAEFLVPVSDAPICKGPDFVANLTKVYTICAFVSVLPLSNSSVPPTTVGIRAAWEDFCSGACMITAKAVLDTYAVCLHPYLKLQGMAQTYLCGNRDSTGDRCGVTMSKFDAVTSCSRNNYQSSCSAASEFCTWTTTGVGSGYSYSYCTASYTQTLLATVCNSCAMGLAKLNNQFPLYGDSEISDGLNQLCLQAPSGAYCLPTMTQFAQAGITIDSLFNSQAAMASVCTNADLLYCMHASTGADAAKKVAEARSKFVYCAKQYSNVTSSVNTYCLPAYKESLYGARQSSGIMNMMCLKNAAGGYCFPLMSNLTNSNCFGTILDSGSCSTSCAASLSSLFSDMGCCVGNAQELITAPDNEGAPLSAEDLPFIQGYEGDTSTPAPTMSTAAPAPGTTAPVVVESGEELLPNPVDGGLYGLAPCNIAGLNQTLRKRCTIPKPVEVSGRIFISMVFNEINANPQRKLRVKASLRIDVAGTARVPVSAIVKDDIVESSSVKVATSAGRRQTTGTTSANGCQYTYTIQAASSTEANLAAANINNAAASGRVPLTTTQATLTNECPSTCAGSGGVNSIDQVQSGSSSSSIRVASTCIAVVAAFLLLL